jgi:hypothetical protein
MDRWSSDLREAIFVLLPFLVKRGFIAKRNARDA